MLEQEEKVNKANVTAMELLGQLKEADAEIEHLRAQVSELQGKVKNLQSYADVYTAVKGDEVDQALAEFLNNF